MSSRPFEEFPITPEPPSEETASGRDDQPPEREIVSGEAWQEPRGRPQPTVESGSSSGEGSLSFRRPWDGNQYAIVVAGEETATTALGPGSEAVLGREVVGAPPIEPRRSFLRSLGRITRELVETLILALLIFIAVRAAVQNFQVEGSSMDPSLRDGQFLLVNKLIYATLDVDTIDRFIPFIDIGDGSRHIFRAPRRGDVVVFRFPGDPKRDFIKRVIGEPGDTVEVKQGTVYIDGRPVDEPYLTHKPNYVVEPLTVPPGHYFVLGDNRPGSFDSHSWIARQPTPAWPNPPFVPEENIIGLAWLSYWPFDDWGLAPNKSLSPSAP